MILSHLRNKFSQIPNGYYFFGIFCVLFVVLMVTVEMVNGKFWTSDLAVYYGATNDYFDGINPYKDYYELPTGYFKYAPTTLYFFYPMVWLKFFIVQILHTTLLTLSLWISISVLHYLFVYREGERKLFGILYLSFSFIAIHVVREFHMGNVNLLLLFFFTFGMWNYSRHKQGIGAIWWSIMIVLKPIVILTFIPLLFLKKWKVIGYMALCGILYFILPIFYSGFNGLSAVWWNWYEAISNHSNHVQSENSLSYLLRYYTGFQSEWGASNAFLVLLMVFLAWSIWKYKTLNTIQWLTLFLAFCPNFFVTDTEHFLLSGPLLIVLLKQLFEQKNAILWVIYSICILFFSFNANDLLGSQISDPLDRAGLLGLTNLIFIVMYCSICVHPRSSSKNQSVAIHLANK